MFNRFFETGGRTVFKVGGGFEILPGEIGTDFNTIKRFILNY